MASTKEEPTSASTVGANCQSSVYETTTPNIHRVGFGPRVLRGLARVGAISGSYWSERKRRSGRKTRERGGIEEDDGEKQAGGLVTSCVQPPPMASAIPNTIPEIDTRIARLRDEILELQRKRNELVPLLRLPNEILSHILALYAHGRGDYDWNAFHVDWIPIMCICRRLRDCVLGQPSLWSYIELGLSSRRALVETKIRNSGCRPLTVKMQLYSTFGDDVRGWFMSNHSAQIGSLQVQGESDVIDQLLKALGDYPLDTLHSLEIESDDEDLPRRYRVQLVLPNELLTGKLPRLKTLSLADVSVSWNLFRGLRRLELYGCRMLPAGSDLTIADILRLLEASPDLRSLSLATGAMSTDNSPDVPISIPNLGYLELRTGMVETTALLQAARLPPSATLELGNYTISAPVEVDNLRNLLTAIHAHLNRDDAPKRHALVLSIHQPAYPTTGPSSCRMELFRTAMEAEIAGQGNWALQDKEFTGVFKFRCETSDKAYVGQLIPELLRTACAEQVTHLDAGSTRDLDKAAWLGVFAVLPALESLCLTTMESRIAVSTAIAGLDALSSRAETTTRIHTLRLRAIDSNGARREHPYDHGEGEWLYRFTATLEAYVRGRREAWRSTGEACTPLSLLEIRDESRFLSFPLHRPQMEHIWEKMDGMGIIVLDGSEWNPKSLQEEEQYV
ncbi:hypothetical protein HMN09_01089900 [Mycena chlorophos]|uniref:F-box domain-containing protein n=1 Tax=Mycena chlorophos TaxID=658473 RepID=A0A8H6SC27_MYCCL|nr:hypothetical protein HMN09_01089900 [Mycena chlorophos]